MDAKKVLLVDDDTDLVTLNRVVLEKGGYTVVAANTGRAGIEKARAEKPDLIVLDVMMTTNSEGFDVARALRSDDATRAIPLLMLTSVNRTVPFKFEPDPTFLPVDRFLEKPLSPEELLKNVRAVLG
jgi:two-component system phosphate regulon response regulator PhoB/two-component system alkaline phosphatase synthesis response regulator PhoP/two-component system response regulator VicR